MLLFFGFYLFLATPSSQGSYREQSDLFSAAFLNHWRTESLPLPNCHTVIERRHPAKGGTNDNSDKKYGRMENHLISKS